MLVVDSPETSDSLVVEEFGSGLAIRVASLGLVVAERLLNLPARHRPVAAADAAADLIRDSEPGRLLAAPALDQTHALICKTTH